MWTPKSSSTLTAINSLFVATSQGCIFWHVQPQKGLITTHVYIFNNESGSASSSHCHLRLVSTYPPLSSSVQNEMIPILKDYRENLKLRKNIDHKTWWVIQTQKMATSIVSAIALGQSLLSHV